MFIFGYAKALKKIQEENIKLISDLTEAYVELDKTYTEISNLQKEIEKLTQKVNKQKQELKNSTYKWK